MSGSECVRARARVSPPLRHIIEPRELISFSASLVGETCVFQSDFFGFGLEL